MPGCGRKIVPAAGNRRFDVKRLLTICLLAAVALAGAACSRLREDAVVVDHDQAVLAVRERSDRLRPAYREQVVVRYAELSRRWAEERTGGSLPGEE